MTVSPEGLDRRNPQRRCPVFALLATPYLFKLVVQLAFMMPPLFSGIDPNKTCSMDLRRQAP